MTVKLYQVGGCVRDQLLGVQSKDIDYAVEANSYEEMLAWIKTQGKVFLESPQHLTVRAHVGGKQPADFVLCRKDGTYSDGRRPDSVTPGTLFDDLARRDFTVNAIAYDEQSGEYIDPYDGRLDLKTMTLKCVGNAKDRFSEDALRMLRAIRFIITKGFKPDAQIRHYLSDSSLIELLDKNISMDRKRDEMQKCFAHDTIQTLYVLNCFPRKLIEAIFEGATGSLWLEPTNRKP